MKSCLVLFLSLGALAVSAAAPEKPTPRQARAAFEAPWRAQFAGLRVLPAEVAGTTNDFLHADGEWVFALRLDASSRLRFVRADIEKGAFKGGEMSYFGLEKMSLTAEDFAVLRRDFAMVARRVKPAPTSVAALYPPTNRPLDKPVPPTARTDLRIAPIGELYGDFLDVVARHLAVKAGDVSYEAAHVALDGERLVLGRVINRQNKKDLSESKVLARVGEVHENLISDRERADYLLTGRFVYTPVVP